MPGSSSPIFVFFAKDNGLRCQEKRHSICWRQWASTVLRLHSDRLIYPQPLYSMLPFAAVEFHAYTSEQSRAEPVSTIDVFGPGLYFMLLPLSTAHRNSIGLSTPTGFTAKAVARVYRFCDWAFNGINDWADHIFVKQFTKKLAQFFEEPGSNLQKYGYRLWVEGSGIPDDQEHVAKQIDSRSRSAAYPVGVGVLLAVVILALVSLLLYLR